MPFKVLCHPLNIAHSQFDFIHPNSMDEIYEIWFVNFYLINNKN